MESLIKQEVMVEGEGGKDMLVKAESSASNLREVLLTWKDTTKATVNI